MKVRKLAVALALAGGLGSNFSYALGMGEARIDSSLNQPLRAEIELVRPGDISRDQIRASIASASDFDRAGVERMGVLRNVELQVVRNDNGDLVIQVTSDSPIREPFLNFLVELTWPSGRLMREYSFLVDPPDYREAPASSGPVAPSAPASAEPESAASPSASREPQPQPQPQPDRVRDEQARQDTRSVRSGDNLWSIAGEVRPAPDMTREQVMLALQDLNPDAFLGNNINRLRGDAVLRLPSEEQIRSRSPQQARQSVQQQHQAFAERSAAPEDQPLAESTDESPLSAPAESQTAQGGDELKLVVDDPESSREGSVGGTGIGEGDAELTLALEELDRADREREELSERLAEMESQVQTLSQLVQLKDDQMAELQAQLAAAQQEDSEQEDPAAATPGESNGDTAVSEPEPETEPEPSLSEQLSSELRTNPYVQIGAGSLGLALLALLLVLARRNARKDEAALSGAGQESEDLLDLSESQIGDPSVGDSDDSRTGADALASMEPSETGSLEVEEEDETPLSMDDLERQLKTGDSGSGSSKEQPQEMEEEGFDLDWDSDTEESGDDEPDEESEQTLDFSSVESDQEEDEETAKTDDDFDFDLDELGEDEPDSDDEEDESLSFTLDEDFDLSGTDSEDDKSGDDDEPLSDEDLATLGLDDEEESSLSGLSEDTQDESDTAQEPESSKSGESPEEASPDSSAAFASSSTEEEDFDDSFLEELDAELDKVTGDDKDEPELGKVAENMDDLELDLSEDDLALMEDSDDKSVDPDGEGGDAAGESLSENESDMDDVPDLSDSELDETLGEGDLEEASELSEEESEALSGTGMDLEESLELGDEDQPRDESESGEKAAEGSQSPADGSQPQADGSDSSADGSDSSADGSGFDDSLLEEAAGVDLNEEEDEFDFLEGTDESGTKLDLARAYVEMGDADGAREILEEVAAEGSDVQQKEARKLLDEL